MNLLSSPFIVRAAEISEWGDCVVDGVPTLKCLEIVFGNILFMASAFIVLTLFIMFIVGAFNYLTSFGNAEKIKKAQGTLRMALVGFMIFVGAYLILNVIQLIFLGRPEKGAPSLFKFEIGGP